MMTDPDRAPAFVGDLLPTPTPEAGCPTLHVEIHRHTARLYGARIWRLLELAGVDLRMYDRALGCWTVPLSRVDAVLCTAEYRQRRFVTVEEVAR